MMQYVTKFIKLAHFVDDFMATNVAKVRRFEDGLKLVIRGKVVGHRLQYFDALVEIAMPQREKLMIQKKKKIREDGAKDKKKRAVLQLQFEQEKKDHCA